MDYVIAILVTLGLATPAQAEWKKATDAEQTIMICIAGHTPDVGKMPTDKLISLVRYFSDGTGDALNPAYVENIRHCMFTNSYLPTE